MIKNIITGQEHLTINLPQEKRDEIIRILSTDLTNLWSHLRDLKPNDRGEIDRRFAIAITDTEKLDAYISQYILGPIAAND